MKVTAPRPTSFADKVGDIAIGETFYVPHHEHPLLRVDFRSDGIVVWAACLVTGKLRFFGYDEAACARLLRAEDNP